MLNMILGVTCLSALAAAFVLGWCLGSRRSRSNDIAVLAAKMGTPKVQGVDPTYPLSPKAYSIEAKRISLLNVAKAGVIALHESWRQKWHGQP